MSKSNLKGNLVGNNHNAEIGPITALSTSEELLEEMYPSTALKYGENGWQTPSRHYHVDTEDPLALHCFKQIGGPEVSYVTTTDLDRLLQTLTHLAAAWDVNFPDETIPSIFVGAKHGNVCGAGWDSGISAQAARLCAEGDPDALFGGVVMSNRRISVAHVETLLYSDNSKRILAGAAAPDFTPEAINLLETKGGKRFVMWSNPELYDVNRDSLDHTPRIRPVRGGFLRQPNYTFVPRLTEVEPTVGRVDEFTIRNLLMAWAIGSTSNSNTITLVRNGQLIANAVGQQSRVGAAKLAIEKAKAAGHWDSNKGLHGAVAYSDSFFPFPDALQILVEAGIETVFSTSGSVAKGGGDSAIIKFCQENGITLLMLPDSEARGFYGH